MQTLVWNLSVMMLYVEHVEDDTPSSIFPLSIAGFSHCHLGAVSKHLGVWEQAHCQGHDWHSEPNWDLDLDV